MGQVTSIVGFLYPAIKSFEAIETKSKGDDTQWLVYWVIFAFFSIVEVFSDILLYWIPFYHAFKLAFLGTLRFIDALSAFIHRPHVSSTFEWAGTMIRF
jgi:TB2/DP1, HVA22 family